MLRKKKTLPLPLLFVGTVWLVCLCSCEQTHTANLNLISHIKNKEEKNLGESRGGFLTLSPHFSRSLSLSLCLYLIYGFTWTLGNAAAPTSNITLSYKPAFWCSWDQKLTAARLPSEDGSGCICAWVWDFKEAAGGKKVAFGLGQTLLSSQNGQDNWPNLSGSCLQKLADTGGEIGINRINT